MGENRVSSAAYGDMDNAVTDFSVSPQTTDGPTGNDKVEYINTRWNQQLGYYKKIPELQSSINALARWTIGKGYKTSKIMQFILSLLRGFGKDSFNTILENQIRVQKISGDSFAEIIRMPLLHKLLNLKPLSPGNMKIIANKQGIITGYEQITTRKKFKPDEIFHLSRDRTADEIHGISLIDAVEEIILMRNEAMADMKKLMHRHVKPVIKWKLDTDNETEIAAFKKKADYVTEHGENIYIPMGTAEADILSVPANATLNPLPWIKMLEQQFYQACGVPQIIVGGSQEMTEATSKIAYVAFEQTIEEEQLYIEEQVLLQLGIELELEFPASLQNDLISSQAKGETMQAATREDTAVTEAV